MHTAARSFLLTCIAVTGMTCLAVSGFVIRRDPYWLLEGSNADRIRPALDTRMRFAKSVQLVQRAPRRILVGSSTVYRGLDPSVIDDELRTFNLGISSMRILEARHYVRHALRFAPVKEVILGLDFFMFDADRRTEAGFDPGLGRLESRSDDAFSSVLSWHALRDAWRTGASDVPTDGVWHRDGHKQTFPRSAESNAALLDSAKREYASMNPDLAPGLAELDGLITDCNERAVRLRIFITPVHSSYLSAMAAAGRKQDFERWKALVHELGIRKGTPIADMAISNPATDSPLSASTRYYIDPSHYSPLVGSAILHALGVPVRAEVRQVLAKDGLLWIGQRP